MLPHLAQVPAVCCARHARACLPPRRRPLCSFNAVNAEHQGIAKELEKAQAEFKEFERKDIKFRCGGGLGGGLAGGAADNQPTGRAGE